MSNFSGYKDEYGKNIVPPNDLSFDRVIKGKHIISKLPLLAISIEILKQII